MAKSFCLVLCRGNIVIWDDGTLGQSLAATLSHVTQVTGSVVIMGGVAMGGSTEAPGLKSLQGMDALQVRRLWWSDLQ
jgi:hypothetical protein